MPILLVGSLTPASPAQAASGGASDAAATSDTSPVNLSTPIDIANGMAHRSAIVRAGDARIEVLSPTLLRLEYSPSGNFENSPTVNAVDRRMPVPRYTAQVSAGWIAVRTSRAVLRYKVGSGPFTTRNTSLQFSEGGHITTVNPTWEWECTFDQVCQGGAASLGGGASISQTLAGIRAVQATWATSSSRAPAPRGTSWAHLPGRRCSPSATRTYRPLPSHPSRARSRLWSTVTHAPRWWQYRPTTATPWSTLTATVPLTAGSNSVKLVSTTVDSFDLGIDTLSIGPVDAPVPIPAQTNPLGGWIRGFDTDTYNLTPTCGQGEQGATCQAGLEPLNTDGLLDAAGWRLLDDTQSARWTRQGWAEPRRANGDVEDGYLFAYGHDYAGALHTLAQLTGPAPLLPRNVFGVWYSDYTPYSSTIIEHSIYPAFVSNDVPLNTLSLDTDWKAPNDWNGWEWNTALFPDASSFLKWARARGIDVTLNIHSSIDDNDPKLPAAERIAGHTLAASGCTAGACKVWDWSSIPQAESNFALQQAFQRQGVAFWWLDWCCDASTVSMAGVTPDSWIDHLYAQEMADQGHRGFVLARIGGSNRTPRRCSQPDPGPTTPRPSPSPVTPGAPGTPWPRRPS